MALWGAFAGLLILKMVLLEPVVVSLLGLDIVLVAALLPAALLLNRLGIGVIALACGVAHWMHGGGILPALIAALAVATAVGAGFLVLREKHDATRWLATGWVITAVLALSMAMGHAILFGANFAGSFVGVLSRVWLALNLLGVPVALLLARRVLVPPSGERMGPGDPEGAHL